MYQSHIFREEFFEGLSMENMGTPYPGVIPRTVSKENHFLLEDNVACQKIMALWLPVKE